MTQLEKAKIITIDKYEEALKRAKEFIGKEECINLEYIFPELRESEDEKIICSLKEIVTYAFSKKGNEVLVSINGLKKDDLIAWLEKQSEPIKVNPTEFDLHLNRLLKQFESLSKEELANGLSFYLNVVQNEGTYKDEEKQSEQEDLQKLFNIAKHQGYKEGLRDGRAEVWAQIEKQGEQKQDPCEHCEDKCLNCHNFPCIKKRAFEQGKSVFEISSENPTIVQSIEPKFKVGDWVVSPNGVYWHIDAIRNDRYQVSSDSGGSAEWPLDTNIYHKFTIQDAKDGDVLADYHEAYDNPLIFILKKFERVNFGLVRPSDYSSYCFLTAGDRQIFKEGNYHYKHDIKPATKEQRDLLFQKMKEAGYTFDFEKKELKKIEQF